MEANSSDFVQKIENKTFFSNLLERTYRFLIWFFRWGLILGISYIILFPLINDLSASFMSQLDLADRTVNYIPRNFTLGHYAIVWEELKYPVLLLNTFLISSMVAVLQLVSACLVGYGFARFDFPLKNVAFALVIFTLIVPPQMVMIPIYLNFRFFDLYGLLPGGGLNLLGSYWPFILTSITGTGLRNGLFIFVMRQFFSNLPKNLEEAAYVDGAGSFKTFYKIMIPSAVPAMLIVFLFAFVWQWSDYFMTSLYYSEAPVLSTELLSTVNYLFTFYEIDEASLAVSAGNILALTPLLLIFVFMQRYFVESVARTGLVG